MKLDDLDNFKNPDPQNMLGEIDNLPAQLEQAWQLGLAQESRSLSGYGALRQVLISGMGGSAIGADLVTAYISQTCRVPVTVHRDYGLPAWARGPETLVIASSHSGNTEETLDSFAAARKAECRIFAICTGGELEKRANAAGVSVWKFDHKGQPRAAVGFSFGLLLSVFSRLGLVDTPKKEMYVVAIDRMGTFPAETLVVGDRLETDIIGAQQLGCPTALVLSGVTSPEAARAWSPPPDYIVEDLATLLSVL